MTSLFNLLKDSVSRFHYNKDYNHKILNAVGKRVYHVSIITRITTKSSRDYTMCLVYHVSIITRITTNVLLINTIF